jgi:hypothetical protein
MPNWITSVQITVRIPPISVQPTANSPMKTMQYSIARPVTVCRMMAVTSTRTLWPSTAPSEKSTVTTRRTPSPRRLPMKS